MGLFELYQRDGRSKERILEGESLEEIAEQSAEKAGIDFEEPEDVFDFEVFDDG